MKLEKITVRTLRQEVYDQLKKKIISAEISPGQAITLHGLARQLGTSLMPVREALWQLQSEKVIVMENNRRIRVNTLTQQEMEEALKIRLILESMAAERSCDLRPDDALPNIKNLLEKMEATIQRPKNYLALNNQFHFAIYSYADSPLLLQIINSLWARIGPYLMLIGLKRTDRSLAIECHRGMFDGLVEKDKEKMVKWLRNDLTQAAEFLIPFLDSS